MTGVGLPALLRRELSGGFAALLLAALVAGAVLAVALAPRLLDRIGDAELHQRLDEVSAATLDISGMGHLGFPDVSGSASVSSLVGTTDSVLAGVPERLPQPFRAAVGESVWLVRTPAIDVGAPGDVERTRLSLAVDLDWASRVRLVAGTAPAAWSGSEITGEIGAPIEAAISQTAADALGLRAGDALTGDGMTVLITAIYEPVDPTDSYWGHTDDLDDVIRQNSGVGVTTLQLGAFVDPGTLSGLRFSFGNGPLIAWYQVDPARLAFADLATLAAQARSVPTAVSTLPYGGAASFRTSLADELDRVGARVGALSGLLALCVSGLAGVLVAVLALAIRSLLERHATALRLAAARGASPRQLRLVMVAFGAIVCLPAAAVGVGAALLLIPGPFDVGSLVAPAVVALIPLVLFGVLVSPSPRSTRRDLSARAGGRTRLVAEFAIIALAVTALVLLTRRGLALPSAQVGIDPLLAATPLLLAVAAAVLILRAYPLPLDAIRRALRRGDGAVGLVGAARAQRDPALGYLPALALLVGVAVVVSATVLSTTVRAGLAEAATTAIGADIQVSASALDAADEAAAREVPGVVAVAPIVIAVAVPFQDDADEGGATLVVADTAALHAVRTDLPVISAGGGDAVPVVVSSDWSERLADGDLRVGEAAVQPVGSVPAEALPWVSSRWLLVDERDVARLGLELPAADRALLRVSDGVSVAATADAVRAVLEESRPADDGGRVIVRDVDRVAAAARTPVIASLDDGLLVVAGGSLLLTMLAVVLASIAAAGSRTRLIGVLRVLGMSKRQVRGVLGWELGPLAVASILGGTALGLALPVVVTSALDLRPFLGGNEQPGAIVDGLAVLGALGAFAAAVLLAGAIAVVVGRRLAPAGAIKMGES